MQQLKQLCLSALVLIFCASCNRIVTADYETVDVGTLRDKDSLNSTVTIQPLNQKNCNTWFVQDACYDVFSDIAGKPTKKFSLGDTIYIYQNDNICHASTYNISDAKKINRALRNYYWKNISNNWYWFLLFAIAMAWFGWGRIENVSKQPFAFIFGGLLICFVCLMTNTGKRLYPVHSGIITRITPTQAELNNGFICPLATQHDIITQLPVKVGQQVTIYRYTQSQQQHEGSVMFLSTRKLNSQILRTQRIYPEILLMTIIWFWLVSFLLIFPVHGIRKCLQKKRRSHCKKSEIAKQALPKRKAAPELDDDECDNKYNAAKSYDYDF